MSKTASPSKFVLRVRPGDSEDLEARKVYEVLPDPKAAKEGYLRIIDESGEDYLYPADCFAVIRLPAAIIREFASTLSPARRARRVVTHANARYAHLPASHSRGKP
jgi:hypothetical protein